MLQNLSLLVLLVILVHLGLSALHVWRRARQSQGQFRLQHDLIKQQVDELIRKTKVEESQVNAWAGWRKFRIVRIEQENATVKSFYLKPHDGKSLPRFLPGQHLTFRLKIPEQRKPIIRCYSLSDDANETDYYRVTIRRQAAPVYLEKGAHEVPDGVSSSFFHDHLGENDVLDVKAPSGKFYLELSERSPVALVAGGIGLTPSLSMLNTLYSLGSERKVFLFYAARNVDDLIMLKHFAKLKSQLMNLSVHFFLADLGKNTSLANTHLGYLSVEKMFALMSVAVHPSDADFYVCGPPAMMDAVVGGLEEKDIDSQRIHFESFGPASITTSVQSTALPTSAESCSVNFHLSETLVEWDVSHGTLLETAEKAGIPMDSGCRAGSCGTCLTAILDGVVEYIDQPGTEVEKGSCLPCIATPRGNLKLNA